MHPQGTWSRIIGTVLGKVDVASVPWMTQLQNFVLSFGLS